MDKNQGGWVSIAGLGLIMLMIIIFAGVFSSGMGIYSATQIQGTMDTAGVAALRSAVDETAFRDGMLVVNETIAKNSFKRLIKESNLKQIISADTMTVSSELIKGDGSLKNVGNGLSYKAERDQYYLVSTIHAQVPVINVVDTDPTAYCKYYDIFKTAKFTMYYNGEPEDGKQEVVVRSVSRLVLR